MLKSIIVIISIVFFTSCAGIPKESVLIKSDNDANQISWLGKTWIENGNLYAGGISSECDTLQQARQQAYTDALTKIAEYSGISVSNNNAVFLNNSYSGMTSHSDILLDKTFLSKALIKDFKYNKTKSSKFVGYILVQYDMRLIEEEKARKNKNEENKKKEIADRKKFGSIKIIAPKNLNLIVTDLKEFLQNEGYLIRNDGKVANLSLVDEEYIEKDGGFTATIKTELNLNDRLIVSRSSGFGISKKDAFRDAVRQWLNYFKDDYFR
jgi:hypothetical protein